MKCNDNTDPLVSYFSMRRKLRDHYDYLALVSQKRDVSKIITPKEKTLVISSDWLLIRELEQCGYDVVFFEYGLRNWGEQELESKLFIRANDWLYINGEDKSLYKGVSLGKLIVREISFVIVGYARLNGALTKICEEFKPKKVYFYNFQSEFSQLDERSILDIVDEVCCQFRAELIIFEDCSEHKDKDFSQSLNYGNHKVPEESYRFLRDFYGVIVEFLSILVRTFTSKKAKVVICTGGHLAQILSKYTKSNNITPIYFSNVLSKNPIDVLSAVLRGAYLARRLNRDVPNVKRKVIAELVDVYLDYWDGAQTNLQTKLVRSHIRNKVFDTELLEYYASVIDLTQRFLRKHQPKRILLDSVLSANSRIWMELAKSERIKVDYIWHGHWEHIIYMDPLGGDVRSEACVDRVYTWGEQNEKWLQAICWKGECIRTGSPFSQKYLSAKKVQNTAVKNILIIEFVQSSADVRILNAASYGFYVDVIRRLKAVGNFNVRLKLHPGLSNRSYYERITDQYSLNCEIRHDGPFDKHVDWADIVIGPRQTGAHLEVLASRKPYYSFVMPVQAKMVHAKHTKFYEDLGQLVNDIRDSVLHDQNEALEELISINQFPRPASALMDGIGND